MARKARAELDMRGKKGGQLPTACFAATELKGDVSYRCCVMAGTNWVGCEIFFATSRVLRQSMKKAEASPGFEEIAPCRAKIDWVDQAFLDLRLAAMPARARPTRASEAGSGTALGGTVELLNEAAIWP